MKISPKILDINLLVVKTLRMPNSMESKILDIFKKFKKFGDYIN
tara:strand:- start:687 stop:818 length:132 start_codon:yes stop_codon:yes gene_type:complete